MHPHQGQSQLIPLDRPKETARTLVEFLQKCLPFCHYNLVGTENVNTRAEGGHVMYRVLAVVINLDHG